MAFNSLSNQTMWLITVGSKYNFTDKNRDFLAELVSEEARKTTKDFSFILHDIIESEKYAEIFIEGTKKALVNLLSVVKDNFICTISYVDTDSCLGQSVI